MMARFIYTALLLSVFSLSAMAQNTLRGGVYDAEQRSRAISDVSVVNISTGTRTTTNVRGQFTIAAKKGDKLVFSLAPYNADTLYLTDTDTKIIYLTIGATSLRNVTLQGAAVANATKNVNPVTSNNTGVYTDKLESARPDGRAGGLILGLGDAKLKRSRERQAAMQQRDSALESIKRNFNEAAITRQLGLKGTELKQFMALYMPDTADITPSFNYSQYITLSYNKWVKLSKSQRESLLKKRM